MVLSRLFGRRGTARAPADAAAEAAEIAEKMKESEARIAEIRESAMQSVEQVAKDTAGAVVAALGAQAGQDEIDRAVEAQLKG